MGMYTRVCASVKLDLDKDNRFANWFNENSGQILIKAYSEHEFFTKERFRCLIGQKNDSYFSRVMKPINEMAYDDWNKCNFWIIDTCLKNYGGEVESFFDFLSTLSSDYVLGFSQYEEFKERTYYLNKRNIW